MARLMAAARFGLTPRAFLALSPGEQVMCMDADRVLRDVEHKRTTDAMRMALAGCAVVR